MYNAYLYQNALASVDQNILASASELAQLDVSSNKLADGSLAFVPEGMRSLTQSFSFSVTRTL